jgi:4,5:9,10-diseco-3-hydroxy-5,9,17-trioxoandrosta-1(10),2-diene-4-oate hydrolase
MIEILGVSIAYNETGQGPAVLCLHAVGHGAGDFAALEERLSARFRIISLDFPGHGGSGPDTQPASATRYAAIVDEFIRQRGIERPILVGNSIGGAAAIELAAKRPERIRGLVVANPGGLFQRSWLSSLVTAAFATIFARGADGAAWFPWFFAAYYRRVLTEPAAAAQRARIVKSAREVAPLLADAWRSFGKPESDLREVARRVTCPVLVTWATKDLSNPLRFNRDGIAQFRAVQLETFAAGHNPFLETPAEAALALTAFAERCQ